jgi:quercetin dioxygenase-like cupin family protein
MEITRFASAPFYTAPNHEGVTARRLQGGDATSADFAWVGYSEFPPGVVVPMEAGPVSKIYVVTQGVITVTQSDGTIHTLNKWDSILISPQEARSVLNLSSELAAIIVITPGPTAQSVR